MICCGGCGFTALWSFSDEVEALLINQSAQSAASVCVVSPAYDMGNCKVNCSLCSVQQVWWSLHWVLRPDLAQVIFRFAGYRF